MKNLNIMNALQLLGRSLMLPIAVLPVAGILLRVGAGDLLNIPAISAAGGAIFDNLALIFAIGIAVGLARDNHGAAALAGATAFLILSGTLKTLDPEINMGVLGGIISGIMAGVYYNRFKDIKLPEYLAFFGGRRFVPIISGATALLLGFIFFYIWPPIQDGLKQIGNMIIASGSIGLFFYGVLNRLLIVTGLHHVINNLVWFQFGDFTDSAGKIVHGDLWRFFAGDKSAGAFMAGMFPPIMFGLPAVALAMYRCARPERRHLVGGMLLSLALTAFLTGITEPIEFAFMFLAPVLYAVHAVLTGISMVVMNLLGIKLGFTFSAGAFDYVLSYGISTNPWLLIPVGLVYFAVYYFIFSWAIRRFDLKVIGREDEQAGAAAPAATATSGSEAGREFVLALGGADNLPSIGACTTRLRLVVKDQNRIDEAKLKALGAMAVMKLRDGNVQVILGPIADNTAQDMRNYVSSGADTGSDSRQTAPVSTSAPMAATADSAVDLLSADMLANWLKALGGQENLQEARAIATTRLRLQLANDQALDINALSNLGAQAVEPLGNGLVHLIFGSDTLPRALATQLSE
ncbi:MAG: Protein-N p-phosphohistidine-sugar phosphotransferase [Candidatus Tokpelaia hoelldobleri]|uniref:Protein-N p-phosphohistidine-sugar phosphotransferase n=1 Tax=Candidatus Tokpelaia hoelldobleri TaxID=1902579 RepID=A0A1U9JV47_9HYPH|nr:MAG: Protein-N p-phosphohistidine-sugar phosphotransferase [Candidatus Tokpelaia hoelldoblerii]